jgi:RNA polymerase nonessential primary-like sigma factor
MAIAGVGEAEGEVAVVAQQESAATVRIQPTHRMQAGLVAPMVWEQIEHGGAALGVMAGGQHPGGFVEKEGQGSRGGGKGLAGNANPVEGWVGLGAQLGYTAVHPHLAIPEKGFGLAAGAESGACDQFLEPFLSHLPIVGALARGGSQGGANEKQWYGYETQRFRNLAEMPSIFLDTSAAQAQTGDLLRSYLRDIGRVPLLTHEQEITLGRQVQELVALEELESELTLRSGGEAPSQEQLAVEAGLTLPLLKRRLQVGRRAKERMVAANLRLVVSVAKKYTKRNMELLDLIQEGTIGLVRGVEKFDPTRGYKFSTYAYWWIRQGITRAIAEKSRSIRLPIHITETLNKLKKGQRELSQELGRTPTVSELAVAVELPEEEVKDLLCRARQPVSLETKVGDGEDTELLDLLSGDGMLPEEMVDGECLKGDLRALVEQLPELQGRVLKMRYGMEGEEPMSLTGIGRVLGISRDRVRNLERDALAGLRRRSSAIEAYMAS